MNGRESGPPPHRQSLGFIGAGRLGAALAHASKNAGYRIEAVSRRNPESAARVARELGADTLGTSDPQGVVDRADLVFICTPDDRIVEVVRSLRLRPEQVVLHCSGATPVSALAPALTQGARTGGFHPLQTFPGCVEIPDISGVTFGIESADPAVLASLERLAGDLGGPSVRLDETSRPLYHAAAVMAGPMVSALAGLAAELWCSLGEDREAGRRALAPLIRATAEHFASRPIPDAMTGPYVRGDLETVRAHLDALRRTAPGLLPAYSALSLAQLPLAAERGNISEERIEALRALLSGAAEAVEAESIDVRGKGRGRAPMGE